MKRVIEIDKDMTKALEQGNLGVKYNMYDLVGCVMNSISFDETLDKIKNDVRKLDTIRIDDGSDGYDTMVDLNEVIGILRSYKESEGE